MDSDAFVETVIFGVAGAVAALAAIYIHASRPVEIIRYTIATDTSSSIAFAIEEGVKIVVSTTVVSAINRLKINWHCPKDSNNGRMLPQADIVKDIVPVGKNVGSRAVPDSVVASISQSNLTKETTKEINSSSSANVTFLFLLCSIPRLCFARLKIMTKV